MIFFGTIQFNSIYLIPGRARRLLYQWQAIGSQDLLDYMEEKCKHEQRNETKQKQTPLSHRKAGTPTPPHDMPKRP